jgi:hypothetical protein
MFGGLLRIRGFKLRGIKIKEWKKTNGQLLSAYCVLSTDLSTGNKSGQKMCLQGAELQRVDARYDSCFVHSVLIMKLQTWPPRNKV